MSTAIAELGRLTFADIALAAIRQGDRTKTNAIARDLFPIIVCA
ncbi:MAG TPA: hypothetical protein VK759_02215 [Rhizomicrobium sp.]|nr:hypothetical protein [Rhizomicrobium sp.]